MGLPVLVQPKSSLLEIIIPGETGWLSDGDALEDWVTVLEDIVGWSDNERYHFFKRARKFVAERFSWDIVAYQYKNLYLKATGYVT
jgi:glycosyltransferase involved in cell wall biosynthesis